MRSGSVLDWEVSGWVAVLGVLLAIGLQIWQLTELPFFPGSSGYASCFIGWAVMNIILLLSGRLLAGDQSGPLHPPAAGWSPRRARWPRRPGPAPQLFRANVESCTYFFGFMAVISALFWVFFYLI